MENHSIRYSLSRGNTCLQNKDYNNTFCTFTEVLGQNSDNVEALIGVGTVSLLSNDYN